VHGAQPWRFGAADYQTALSHAAHADYRLVGAPVAAVWDAALAASMQAHGLALAEEALAATLLPDLAGG
jgi:hypothetical protein